MNTQTGVREHSSIDMFAPTNNALNEAYISATGTGLEILGRRAKELICSIQKLRQLGIENLGLPLPKIALIGDQSTGKSSLIEGISEIKVPRSSGTCTRCPLEINLTENTIPGDGWSCKVSLLKKYLFGGAWSSSEEPFGPWIPQEPEEYPFGLVRGKGQVPYVLRLAQLATLNPGQPYENYLPGTANTDLGFQVEFSPNIIRLDISSPGLPNMSFYDLPGVISVHELAEDQYLVDLVKNLVMDYIQDHNCINLLTLPMTDDPSNSNASVLIRRANAEARTVGVLTKPDRIQHGESLSQWVQILENKRFLLGLGYFVVKNNPDPEVDHSVARMEEEVFFRNPPWSTGLKQFRNRFGTLQLQAFLSDRLATQMKSSIPDIVDQVQRKAEQIDAQLAVLPEPAEGNLMLLIVERILQFENVIKRHIDGGDPQYPLKRDLHQVITKFRKMLEESRPVIVEPWEGEIMVDRTAASKGTPLKRKANVVDHPETPTKKPRNRATIVLDSESDELPHAQFYNGRHRNASKTANSPYATRFTVAQIRDIVQGGSICLPNQTDPKVLERMIQHSLKKWETPLDQFLDRTKRLIERIFATEIRKSFGNWSSTHLHTRVVEVCSAFLDEAMATERESAKRALQLELRSPTAYDHASLNAAVENSRAEVKAARRAYLTEAFIENQRANSGSPTKPGKPISEDHLGSDPSAKEYDLLATVRGYYIYAKSRFVDVVSQGIKGGLLLTCRNELGGLIKTELGITDTTNGEEHYARLLEVDLPIRERRVQLEKERAMINEAREWLDGMTSTSITGGPYLKKEKETELDEMEEDLFLTAIGLN